MKVRDALLLELDRDTLVVICRTLTVEVPDGASATDLVSLVRRHPAATESLLVNFLSVVGLRRTCSRVGLSDDGDRQALVGRLLVGKLGTTDVEPPAAPLPIVPGALISWSKHEQLGVVVELSGRKATVAFDDGQTTAFSIDAGVLTRVEIRTGQPVTRVGDERVGVVLGPVEGRRTPTYQVSFPEGVINLGEGSLRPAVINDPVERMRTHRLGDADDFNLRAVAADYWTAHHHNELVSLASARVDLKPHQVFVVHKIVQNYPHRFLLCDEVGLGKTIEAAMAIKELRARGLAKRVLILVPSGLTRQWQFELKTKFNESFAIYDATTVKYLKGKGVPNPWTDTDSVIVSHTWASWTPQRQREIADVDWDMVIVDEAHHARLRRYGNSSHRTKLYQLVSELVARPEFSRRAALFLTATPLQLDRSELYSLVEMLNPILFASDADFATHLDSLAGLNKTVENLEQRGMPKGERKEELAEEVAKYLEIDIQAARDRLSQRSTESLALELRARHRLSEVLIRNRKSVVGGFQPRVAAVWEVDLSADELRIHELMDRVLEEGFRVAEETRQNVLGFVMVILQKLLASSSRALLTSLLKRMQSESSESGDQISKKESLAVAVAEENLEQDTEASSIVSDLARGQGPSDQFYDVVRLLQGIDIDSKARVLIERLSDLIIEDPNAKVVVFTEFRETQAMLADLLSERWGVNIFHGQLSPDSKDRAIARFKDDGGPQILVSTEAGGEGRNFQFAHHIVNYDLPWNPMRVEQRIGRLDRIGQEHPVTIFNFHVHGTIEGRIFEVLDRRIHVFEQAVGGLDPILGEAESDIRKVLRLARDQQEAALERLGLRLETRVESARNAEEKLRDFILEAKSFSAGIAREAMQLESPIDQDAFARFLAKLLQSSGTYVGPLQPSGEREIMFHAPFALEAADVIGGIERRRVCFDPRLFIDSEHVEYFGFGHPIVDRLVRRVIEDRQDGAAAVRKVDQLIDRPGWLFVWLVNVGGLKTSEFVFPVFVEDDGVPETEVAESMLIRSRIFERENSSEEPDLATLDRAYALADERVGERRDEELALAQGYAADRAAVEEQRTRAVFEERTRAARDRITSCRLTLDKLQRATESQVRQAIPLWEANLARAEVELESLGNDLEKSLLEIARRRNPIAEYRLLSVARMIPSSEVGVPA